VQELIHQPSSKGGDPRFAGKDWRQVKIGEFVQNDDVKWVELDTGVEEATKVCACAGRGLRSPIAFPDVPNLCLHVILRFHSCL